MALGWISFPAYTTSVHSPPTSPLPTPQIERMINDEKRTFDRFYSRREACLTILASGVDECIKSRYRDETRDLSDRIQRSQRRLETLTHILEDFAARQTFSDILAEEDEINEYDHRDLSKEEILNNALIRFYQQVQL